MSGHRLWNPATKPDNAKRLDISSQSLWNPTVESDKAERLDMSGMGAGHVRPESLEFG
jgi:hypothetical protein